MSPKWIAVAEQLRSHIGSRRWITVKEVRWYCRHVLKQPLPGRAVRLAIRKHLGWVSVSAGDVSYWAAVKVGSEDILKAQAAE